MNIGCSTIIASNTRVREIGGVRSQLCCNSRLFECEFRSAISDALIAAIGAIHSVVGMIA